ncbi:MAG: F0F1 ATP synthase subunit A [Bradymonadaceae bacterium]
MAGQTVYDGLIEELEPSGGWHEMFGHPLMQGEAGHLDMSYLFMMGTVMVVVGGLALVARRRYRGGDKRDAMIPEGHFSVRNMFEAIFDATLKLMSDLMGREDAKKYFPLIATLSVFILFCNLLGLVPGFTPPTQNLNLPVAMAVSVFLAYNAIGISRRGWSYLEDFVGPDFGLPAIGSLVLSTLLFLIETIGHLARPLSLSVRLSGNMTADHKVLSIFGKLSEMIFGGLGLGHHIPLGLPIFIMALGFIIALVQTLVFALLSAIYIAVAVEEGH